MVINSIWAWYTPLPYSIQVLWVINNISVEIVIRFIHISCPQLEFVLSVTPLCVHVLSLFPCLLVGSHFLPEYIKMIKYKFKLNIIIVNNRISYTKGKNHDHHFKLQALFLNNFMYIIS